MSWLQRMISDVLTTEYQRLSDMGLAPAQSTFQVGDYVWVLRGRSVLGSGLIWRVSRTRRGEARYHVDEQSRPCSARVLRFDHHRGELR
jgi:hypothetical protein